MTPTTRLTELSAQAATSRTKIQRLVAAAEASKLAAIERLAAPGSRGQVAAIADRARPAISSTNPKEHP